MCIIKTKQSKFEEVDNGLLKLCKLLTALLQ